jgi:hypothetical protein
MRFAKLPLLVSLSFVRVALAQPAPAPPAAEPPQPAPAPPAAEPPPAARPAPAPLKIETPSSSLKLGVLLQPQYEIAGNANAAQSGVSHNLFVRRIRLLAGATLFKNIDLFFDTDYPDLFKAAPDTGFKNTPGLNVQDAFATVKAYEDFVKVDMGYMLPPSTHNADQGAGTLYSWDYFSNSFTNSNSFSSSGRPVGRDAGLQLRGLVLDNHLEYRAGLFQGRRNPVSTDGTKVGSRNFFRFAARLQVNLLDPETGFFYAGSYLGSKKVLSFGATFDKQDEYIHWGADAIADLPLGPGVLTAQVNLAHYDGKDFLVPLPAAAPGAPPVPVSATTAPLAEQTAIMAEAGYLIDAVNLSPILRFEWQSNDVADSHETRVGGGLAFWPYGHAFNIKAFFQRVTPDAMGQHGFNQFNLQTQVYIF